jgi:molecular chaperone GrpE (heat shock protein)
MGIVEINAENMYFSPEYHDAVNIIKTNDEKLDGKVASVYKKGYKLADDTKVIRHAQVEIYKF